jgi:hypothetical protein
MIDQAIFDKASELQSLMNKQLKQAKEELKNLPDGEMKTRLNRLLAEAAKGKVNPSEAAIELQKIMNHAR